MPKVTFIADNKIVEAEAGELMREVCQRNDFTIPFGCENGVCGTCLISIKEGADHLTEPTNQEKETLDVIMAYPDQRLGCQCQVQGDVTFDLE
ncbi:MAG: (2Fe-2S)-binding protein [Candidatus Kerfeldbacteria bacterium]|nr:(2Fe-2S)-binding protein [Candidatus Kerfeldbacteria bacterium]